MIIKLFTNTTYKHFIMNWNIYHNDILSVKTIHIPPKALNLEISFADEADFEKCKSQNALYFANDEILIGKTSENNAIKQNIDNATENLKEAQEKIDKEVDNLQEQAQIATKGKKSSTKIEVTTEQAGE